MTPAYKICDRGHFEFCLHFEFYFYPFSVYLQAGMIRFVHKVHFDVEPIMCSTGL